MLIDKTRLAQAFGISRPTLHEWQNKGYLPRPHKSPADKRLVMFDVGEVLEYARKYQLNAALGVLIELQNNEAETPSEEAINAN